MAKKKTPVDAINLAEEAFTGADEIENLVEEDIFFRGVAGGAGALVSNLYS